VTLFDGERQQREVRMAQPSSPFCSPLAGLGPDRLEEAIFRQKLSIALQQEIVRRARDSGAVPAIELNTLAELESDLAALEGQRQHVLARPSAA
jgi:hypothetical protein